MEALFEVKQRAHEGRGGRRSVQQTHGFVAGPAGLQAALEPARLDIAAEGGGIRRQAARLAELECINLI